MFASASTSSTAGDTGGVLLLTCAVIAVICCYFLPSIIAILRGVNLAYVICINLFFGWTFVGWLCAFISACATKVYLDPYPTFINSPGPAAGWWPDPSGAGLRFWDGTRWTQHVTRPGPERLAGPVG